MILAKGRTCQTDLERVGRSLLSAVTKKCASESMGSCAGDGGPSPPKSAWTEAE